MKWSREEYIEMLAAGKKTGKSPMFSSLFGLLVGLDNEWKDQGASEEEISLSAFDFDTINIVDCGGSTGIHGGLTPKVIEDTDEYTISIDQLGRKMKLCKASATIPLPLDYPVKDMDSWLKIKPMYEFHEDRIDQIQLAAAIKARKEGALVKAYIPGGYDEPRELLGDEQLCFAYYDQPELIKDILETIGNTAHKVLDYISDQVIIDEVHVHEDMAGKSGCLIGPNLIEEFLKPYYRKIWDLLSSKGTRIFSQDSDGNMNSVIDAFLDCGINMMLPMEPAAGMDIVALKKKYGNRLLFRGGIDKHILRSSKEDIRKELEYKMQDIMLEGGVEFSLDHRITNGTSIDNFRFYVDTAREILGLPQLKK